MSIKPTIAQRIAMARRIPESTIYPGIMTYRPPTLAELEQQEAEDRESQERRDLENAQLIGIREDNANV